MSFKPQSRPDVILLAGLSIVVLAFAIALRRSDAGLFEPFFGALDPLAVVIAVGICACFSLWLLQRRGWFRVYERATFARGCGYAVAGGLAFALAIVLVDTTIGFPLSYAVAPPFPASAMFYTLMAYVAETVFHLVPLAVLSLLVTRFLGHAPSSRAIWSCLAVVALAEPVFQLRFALAGPPLGWLNGYVFAHVLAFDVVLLYLLRRFDFVSALVFRLTYYSLWHVIWGALRQHWPS